MHLDLIFTQQYNLLVSFTHLLIAHEILLMVLIETHILELKLRAIYRPFTSYYSRLSLIKLIIAVVYVRTIMLFCYVLKWCINIHEIIHKTAFTWGKQHLPLLLITTHFSRKCFDLRHKLMRYK